MENMIEIQKNHLFDIETLKNYLNSNLDHDALLIEKENFNNLEVKQFVHGQSNPSFYLNYKNKKMVLRKKPHGKLLKGAHMIDREFYIISKLFSVGYPVPKPIKYCEDRSIIGTEFYLMDYVEGRIFRDLLLQNLNPQERYEIYRELIKVIAQLQLIDIRNLGIQDYGSNQSNYFERILTTWSKQYLSSQTQKIEEVDFLINWLPKNIPKEDHNVCLVHGDFRLDNVVFHPVENKIVAVLDWELSTLGSKFADPSYCSLMYYFPTEFFGLGNFDKGFYGIPSETEFKNIFFELTKMQEPSQIDWYFYIAVNSFKMAGIAQGVYSRSIQGNASSPYANLFLKRTITVAKIGYSLCQKSIESKNNQNNIHSLYNDPFIKFFNNSTNSSGKLSERFFEIYIKLLDFMEKYVYPNERHFLKEIDVKFAPDRWSTRSLIVKNLKNIAKNMGLWNLFLPDTSGLTNLEYGLLCKIMGRSLFFAPEIFNCSAPDTGNAEVIFRYGTDYQKEIYLKPLLDGEIRSCFAMTEKGTPSSDATNISSTILLDPNDNNYYIINGRKWWISGAGDPRCKFIIFLGRSHNKNKPLHQQHSMIIIPMDTPGIKIIRPMKIFGYDDAPHGHMDILFTNVRVSKENILVGEGKGFEIAQGRLGPGRIHHCMRILGATERCYENLLHRASTRKIFGKLLNQFDDVIKKIALCKTELTQAILLVLFTADKIDQIGSKKSKDEIAMIKIAIPNIALKIIDEVIQIHGAEGLSQDSFSSIAWAQIRTLRIADGPDEVHLQALGKSLVTAKF